MSLWSALLFLILLGALIAYAGDVIGRKAGRRHLRFFGLRPRTTGLLIAVLSGVVIAVTVFFAFMLLARDARETILEAETVRQERNALLQERAKLLKEQARLKETVENLKAQAARAFANEEELRAKARELAAELKNAERQLAEKEAKLEALNAALEEKERILKEKEAELEARGQELEKLKAQAEATGAKLAEMEAESAALRAELKNLKAARAEAEARARSAIETLSQLKAEQERLSAEVFKLRSEAKKLEGDVAELTAVKSELEARNRALEAENRRLLQALDEARLSTARLRGQLGELSKTNKALEAGLNELVRDKVLAEVPLKPGQRPEAALETALQAARSTAALLGFPTLAVPQVSTANWRGPGLIYVRSRHLDHDGHVVVEVGFVPEKTLYDAGAVIVAAEVPKKSAAALKRLWQQAEERLRARGVPDFLLARSRPPDGVFEAEAKALTNKGPARVAVVAKAPVKTTGPVQLAFRRLR